jgi:hypothetical protein
MGARPDVTCQERCGGGARAVVQHDARPTRKRGLVLAVGNDRDR